MTLFYILIATFSISLIAFIGALLLFLKEEILNKLLLVLVSFSAGALVGGAFLHLLPEAIEEAGEENVLKIFLFVISGFVTFFIMENFIHWHHHHAKEHPEIRTIRSAQNLDSSQDSEIMPFSYLILISDALHNFIDGIVIAASFVVALPVGIVASLAVILHEIPQEIGDFGILIYGGFKRAKALFLNFLSAVFAILGGVIGFFISEKIGESIIFLLPFAAGNFIYIACSDLIPEIKQKTAPKRTILYFLVFLLGLALMYGIRYLPLP